MPPKGGSTSRRCSCSEFNRPAVTLVPERGVLKPGHATMHIRIPRLARVQACHAGCLIAPRRAHIHPCCPAGPKSMASSSHSGPSGERASLFAPGTAFSRRWGLATVRFGFHALARCRHPMQARRACIHLRIPCRFHAIVPSCSTFQRAHQLVEFRKSHAPLWRGWPDRRFQ